MRRWLPSTSARLALEVMGLFLIAFVMIGGGVYFAASTLLLDDARGLVRADANDLVTIHRSGGMAALRAAKPTIGFSDLIYNDKIGKVSVIGVGMRSHPGVSATAFRAMAGAGINIEMISTSEIRISMIVDSDLLDKAVRAVHTAFGLDSEGQAVVYAGTGR